MKVKTDVRAGEAPGGNNTVTGCIAIAQNSGQNGTATAVC